MSQSQIDRCRNSRPAHECDVHGPFPVSVGAEPDIVAFAVVVLPMLRRRGYLGIERGYLDSTGIDIGAAHGYERDHVSTTPDIARIDETVFIHVEKSIYP